MNISGMYRLWRNAKELKKSLKEANMEKVKAGIKTTEFWLALLGAILPVMNTYLGLNIPTESIISIAGIVISYVLGRSWLKRS